ncbi:MAG: hypothetical protein AAGL17_01590 [Cyanobacteria bacterium J06576_12]
MTNTTIEATITDGTDAPITKSHNIESHETESHSTDAHNTEETTLKVTVLVLRGGGGHYATYLALRAVIEKYRPHWQLTPIFADTLGQNAQNRTAGQVAQIMGTISDNFYDTILKNGFGWLHLITVHIHKLITRIRHKLNVGEQADI